MRRYNPTNEGKPAYIAAQHDYLQRVAQHCDYAITLQTSLRTCGIKAKTMEDRLYKAQASVRQLRNRLLTGNGYKLLVAV